MAVYVWRDELPRLSGPRLELRALEREDAPAILGVFGDPAVMKYWSSPPLPGLDAALEVIEETQHLFAARQGFQWGICLRETRQVLGTCTLFHLDLAHRRAEVGFALRSDCWGRGFASETLRTVFRFAFETLDLHRLEADVDPDNSRSLRLLERHGFRREGHLRERWHHLGQIRDAIFLGLLRTEWPESPGRST